MDAFLAAAHVHYDLVVWSATHWRWLEVKLTELGMLAHPRYRIACVLDKSSMFRIISERDPDPKGAAGTVAAGDAAAPVELKHSVKPLQILWTKFPDRWHARHAC